MTLNTVKSYLRVDGDEDDGIIGICMSAAQKYITEAVGSFDETDGRVQMVYLAAVQDFYDNRTYASPQASASQYLRHMLNSLILQLQIEEYEDTEESEDEDESGDSSGESEDG